MKAKIIAAWVICVGLISSCNDTTVDPATRPVHELQAWNDCFVADPTITGIKINYTTLPQSVVTPGTYITFKYAFTTTNVGVKPMKLKDYYFQTYISKTNPLFGPTGEATGGSTYLNTWEEDVILNPGESFTREWANYGTLQRDLFEYKYVVVQVKKRIASVPDCNPNNNYAAQYIDLIRLSPNHQ